MAQVPKLNEIRGRVQQRIADLRASVGTRRNTTGQMIGNGVIAGKVMNRANTLSQRLIERKPGMIPMVKEFKPGDRLRKVLTPQGVLQPPNPVARRVTTGGSIDLEKPMLRTRGANLSVQI